MRKYIVAIVILSAGILLFSCGGDEKKTTKNSLEDESMDNKD